MIEAPESRYRVPFDGSWVLADAATDKPKHAGKGKELEERLAACVEEMRSLQDRLYAADRHALLLVFQAMDAAGKDGTIRAVMSGINPAGCQVFSFKQPSAEELDHDFLWRTSRCLPERGRIGIFNRSYYEEVLVVRVHPAWLAGQKLPPGTELKTLWGQRFESIREHEQHLARSGTVVLKFFLNVSQAEQKGRLLARLDDPAKNWKFSRTDVAERAHWPSYMAAYEDALNATSRPWAPWYAIPADSKAWMRLQVAETVVAALRAIDPRYPELDDVARRELVDVRAALEAQD